MSQQRRIVDPALAPHDRSLREVRSASINLDGNNIVLYSAAAAIGDGAGSDERRCAGCWLLVAGWGCVVVAVTLDALLRRGDTVGTTN